MGRDAAKHKRQSDLRSATGTPQLSPKQHYYGGKGPAPSTYSCTAMLPLVSEPEKNTMPRSDRRKAVVRSTPRTARISHLPDSNRIKALCEICPCHHRVQRHATTHTPKKACSVTLRCDEAWRPSASTAPPPPTQCSLPPAMRTAAKTRTTYTSKRCARKICIRLDASLEQDTHHVVCLQTHTGASNAHHH
jgi:hypothetical protein